MPKIVKDQYSSMDLSPSQRYKLRHADRVKRSNAKYDRTVKGKERKQRYLKKRG